MGRYLIVSLIISNKVHQDQVIHVGHFRFDQDIWIDVVLPKHGVCPCEGGDVQRVQKAIDKNIKQSLRDRFRVASHGEITYPIARDLSSLLKRKTSLEGNPHVRNIG